MLVLAVALAPTAASGCSGGCKADCVGPRVEITVGNGLAAVEVCDAVDVCTRQEFGPDSEQVITHAFTLIAPNVEGATELHLRGFLANGTESVSGTVTARFPKGECGCVSFAQVYVNTDAVGTYDR